MFKKLADCDIIRVGSQVLVIMGCGLAREGIGCATFLTNKSIPKPSRVIRKGTFPYDYSFMKFFDL